LISGDDLIEMGYKPGPLFKRILVRVEDEQLEGSIVSREQALDFVRSQYSRSSPS
jgi:poly(A) polymerase